MVRSGDNPGADPEPATSPRVIRVTVKTPRQKEEFLVREDRPIKEFKDNISARFSSPTDQLVLIFAGRILKDHQTLRQHGIHDAATVYLVIQSRRSQEHAGQNTSSPKGDAATPGEDGLLSRPDSTGSVAFGTDGLQEFVSSLGLNTANFSAFQSQLTSNPEMMFQLLENPFIQSRLSNPDLMADLIADNPLTQQVIQKSPEIGRFLNTPDMLGLMVELARSPATVREIMKDPSQALGFLASILGGGSDRPDFLPTAAQTEGAGNSPASPRNGSPLASSQAPLRARRRPSPPASPTPSSSPSDSSSCSGCSLSDCPAPSYVGASLEPGKGTGADISTILKSLLQQTIKPLVQNILAASGARGERQPFSQDPDPGPQALPQGPPPDGKSPTQPLLTSHPPSQPPEALPDLREMPALAQIQQRLQALAMGEPGVPLQFLSPLVGLGHPDSVSGLNEAAPPASAASSPPFTVQQMLQALAGANPPGAQNL